MYATCNKCNKKVGLEDNHCPHCGALFVDKSGLIPCAKCNKKFKIDNNYCSHCGTKNTYYQPITPWLKKSEHKKMTLLGFLKRYTVIYFAIGFIAAIVYVVWDLLKIPLIDTLWHILALWIFYLGCLRYVRKLVHLRNKDEYKKTGVERIFSSIIVILFAGFYIFSLASSSGASLIGLILLLPVIYYFILLNFKKNIVQQLIEE